MSSTAFRCVSIAALIAAPVCTAFAAQSSTSVPNVPPSNWKPDKPVEFVVQAAVPHLKTGRIRALGVGGVKRSALLPDVPTVAESGLDGYQSTGWRGIMGPAGIPAPIAQRLAAEVKTIVSSDEVKTHFLNNAMEIDYRDPKDFAVFIADEIKRWSGVVRKAKISLQSQ